MTPMIDVTFLLLIFFMCTVRFKTLEGKLGAFLPHDVGASPREAEPSPRVELRMRVVEEGTRLDPASAQRLVSRDPARVAPFDPARGSRWVYGDDRVLEVRIGPRAFRELDDVEARLRELAADARGSGDAEPKITLDVEAGAVYEDVVHLLDRVIDAGFTDVSFAGGVDGRTRIPLAR